MQSIPRAFFIPLRCWVVVCLLLPAWAGAASLPEALEQELSRLYRMWAEVYFLRSDKEREAGVQPVIEGAVQLQEKWPARPEPLIMEAVARSAWAEKAGRLKALEEAKQARKLLERAIEIDPLALQGAAWVTLGTLYYRVPGWPVGFGNEDKARAHLERAIEIDPHNLDAYFFYGEFLQEVGENRAARTAWQTGLAQPVRERFPVADAGRRRMIREKLEATR